MVRAAGVLAVRQPRGRHGGRWDQAAVIKMRELVRLETALEFRQRAKHVKDKPPLRRFVLDSPLEGDGFELPVPRRLSSRFEASLALLERGVPAQFPPAAYALLQGWQNRAPHVSAPDRVALRYLRP